MDDLSYKKRNSLIIDIISYIVIFFSFYVLFLNILPYEYVRGPGFTQVISYEYIDPFAGGLLILLLFRFITLYLFSSSFGMKLKGIKFDKEKFSLIKYDVGAYLVMIATIILSIRLNTGPQCCGLFSGTETLIFSGLMIMLAVGIIFWALLFEKRRKAVQIILR